MNILFVCTGNTCRSPMAEAIFKRMVDADYYYCASAGLAAFDGQPASPYAVQAMKEWDIDLSAHKSRRVSMQDFAEFDLFFVMSNRHKDVLVQSGLEADRVVVPSGEIADPYGGGLDDYRACRDDLKRELNLWLEELEYDRSADA